MTIEFWQEWYRVFFNIFLFIVIQSVFFYFVSSGFVKNIIKDKIARISNLFYKQMNSMQKTALLKKLKEDKQKIEPVAKKNEKEHAIENANALLLKAGIPALIAGLLFIVPFIINPTLFTFSWVFFLPLLYMLLAYTTEVGIFGILMNRYEYIGTFEILNSINDKLPSLTPEQTIGV